MLILYFITVILYEFVLEKCGNKINQSINVSKWSVTVGRHGAYQNFVCFDLILFPHFSITNSYNITVIKYKINIK